MSLSFDPKTGHFRNENEQIVYNPGGPQLPNGTPVLVYQKTSSVVSKAMRDQQLNEAIFNHIKESQAKRAQSPSAIVSYLDKQFYVTARDPSFEPYAHSMKYFKELGQKYSNPYRPVQRDFMKEQEEYRTFYQQQIEKRYDQLKALEEKPVETTSSSTTSSKALEKEEQTPVETISSSTSSSRSEEEEPQKIETSTVTPPETPKVEIAPVKTAEVPKAAPQKKFDCVIS